MRASLVPFLAASLVGVLSLIGLGCGSRLAVEGESASADTEGELQQVPLGLPDGTDFLPSSGSETADKAPTAGPQFLGSAKWLYLRCNTTDSPMPASFTPAYFAAAAADLQQYYTKMSGTDPATGLPRFRPVVDLVTYLGAPHGFFPTGLPASIVLDQAHRTDWVPACLKAAQAQGVDVYQYQAYNMLLNQNVQLDNGLGTPAFNVDGHWLRVAMTFTGWATFSIRGISTHEMGHALNLPHSHLHAPGNVYNEYGDRHSVMGEFTYLAMHPGEPRTDPVLGSMTPALPIQTRWYLGWIPSTEHREIATDQTVRIYDSTRAGAVRSVMVTNPFNDAVRVCVELRKQELPYDKLLAEGVILRECDKTGHDSDVLGFKYENLEWDPIWPAGSTADFAFGVQVKVASVATDFSYADLEVKVPGWPVTIDSSAPHAVGTKTVFVANVPYQMASEFTFTWTFPDGSTATGSRVEKQFNTPGKYVVQLAATYRGNRQTLSYTASVGTAADSYWVPRVHAFNSTSLNPANAYSPMAGFDTRLVVSNPSATAAHITVNYRSGRRDDSAGAVPTAVAYWSHRTIPPYSQMLLTDMLENTSGDPYIGTAQVSSDNPAVVIADEETPEFYSQVQGNPSLTVPRGTEAARVLMVPRVRKGDVKTQLSVVNASGIPMGIRVSFRRFSGSTPVEVTSRTFTATRSGEGFTLDTSDIPLLPIGFDGFAVVTAEGPGAAGAQLVGSVLEVSSTGSTVALANALPAIGNYVNVPRFQCATFNASTVLRLANPGATAISAQIDIFGSTDFGSTTVTVPALATATVDVCSVPTQSGLNSQYGGIRISGTGPVDAWVEQTQDGHTSRGNGISSGGSALSLPLIRVTGFSQPRDGVTSSIHIQNLGRRRISTLELTTYDAIGRFNGALTVPVVLDAGRSVEIPLGPRMVLDTAVHARVTTDSTEARIGGSVRLVYRSNGVPIAAESLEGSPVP